MEKHLLYTALLGNSKSGQLIAGFVNWLGNRWTYRPNDALIVWKLSNLWLSLFIEGSKTCKLRGWWQLKGCKLNQSIITYPMTTNFSFFHTLKIKFWLSKSNLNPVLKFIKMVNISYKKTLSKFCVVIIGDKTSVSISVKYCVWIVAPS